MESRKCKKCNETFSLTEDFFHRTNKNKGVINYTTTCKRCRNYQASIRYKENKLKAEIAKQESWKDPFRDKIFICKHCGEKKNFDQMRVNATNKAMDSRCKACYNKKSKEYNKNYDANCFIKSKKKGS